MPCHMSDRLNTGCDSHELPSPPALGLEYVVVGGPIIWDVVVLSPRAVFMVERTQVWRTP